MIVRGLAAGAILAALATAAWIATPLPSDILERDGAPSVRFLDRTGLLLREQRAKSGERAEPLPAGPIPPRVRAAFLAAEDRRFATHWGIDPRAIVRTVGESLRAGRVTGGASTITQQLARRIAPRPRSLAGKVREALWALRLTAHLPRETILRAYLDRVALGNGTAGVEAAARFYFDRPAARLSLGQAALLAGMAAAPARFDPVRHPERAHARMALVLARMVRAGMIDEADAKGARNAPLDVSPPERAFRAPHLVAWLGRTLEARGLGGAAVVETTIDPALQRFAEEAIGEELRGLAARDVGQAAALVLDNATGEVLAYAGSADFFDDGSDGQNDGVRARRQPGSTLKPFAYALALASGATAADLVPDVEARFSTPTGDFAPRNYDRRLHGPVRLRAALANSYNVPAVRVAERVGPARLLDALRRAGFESLTEDAGHYGVGLVLGDGEVTLYELARAYRGLAAGGVLRPATEVRGARDRAGRALPLPAPAPARRFLPQPAAALVTDILADAAARVPAFGLDNALRFPFPVAAKTGTSRAHVDNWVVGFTRERTVAVWVGNFDGRPMRDVSGITGAGPLFKRLMLRAMEGIAPAPLIDRSRFAAVEICTLSGARATAECPSRLDEVFLPRTAPEAPCPMHRRDGGGRLVVDVGPAYAAWARGEGYESAAARPGDRDGDLRSEARAAARPAARPAVAEAQLLVPGDGDEYLLDPTMPAQDQTIPVRAHAGSSTTALDVYVDGRRALRLARPFVTRIAATPGPHRIELREPGALRAAASASFVVR